MYHPENGRLAEASRFPLTKILCEPHSVSGFTDEQLPALSSYLAGIQNRLGGLQSEIAARQLNTGLKVVRAAQEREDDELIEAAEVAAMVRMNRKWVYRHKKALGGFNLSRKKVKFWKSKVEAYLKAQDAEQGRQ